MKTESIQEALKNNNLKVRLAVVGATGVVGKEVIKILEERKFPVDQLRLLASEKSKGTLEVFNGKKVVVEVLESESFNDIDIAIFSAGSEISKKFAPLAAEKGVYCIDNTSFFRMDKNIPLVVPEINGEALKKEDYLIANPNCSTAQVVMALAPLHQAIGIKRLVYNTYQSVSGAGKGAIQDLEDETRQNLAGKPHQLKNFSHPIAFNVIPKIDVFLENGYTKEEWKMIEETKKILSAPHIAISATAVRVPVFVGHAVSVNIEFEKDFDLKAVRSLLENTSGLTLLDEPDEDIYPTPREQAGQDDVFVGRIRRDVSVANGLELWCVADNLRKGAALNAVQIAEKILQKEFISSKSQ